MDSFKYRNCVKNAMAMQIAILQSLRRILYALNAAVPRILTVVIDVMSLRVSSYREGFLATPRGRERKPESKEHTSELEAIENAKMMLMQFGVL